MIQLNEEQMRTLAVAPETPKSRHSWSHRRWRHDDDFPLRPRYFENGVWTDDPALVRTQEEQFDAVWRGDYCLNCGRREHCWDPVR